MNTLSEFHYRLPGRTGGFRPGSHPGSSFGPGQEFALHARLFDHPDPRRIDLRASLLALRQEWLVRVNLQRVAVPVHVMVDVSGSMHFGMPRSKLQVAADFTEALGYSAFRAGDQVGMLGFDADERDDLFMPARYGRGVGDAMAARLRHCAGSSVGDGGAGLERAALKLGGRAGLVFVVSDFHWDLGRLAAILDTLVHAWVVPMIVWDRAELEPPSGGLLALSDAESGAQRTLWLRAKVRSQWREAVARRRAELIERFGRRAIRPFFLEGAFDPEALSRYFLEAFA
jgi:uncharacterized protein (DUF58 family)